MRRHADTLHMAAKHLVGELSAIVRCLLGKHTRARMLDWLGAVIEGNGERAKMQGDSRVSKGGRQERLGPVARGSCLASTADSCH
jgi:Ubiquitin elongating factor core